MAITVQGVRGATGSGDSTTTGSFTSTTGSTLIAIGHFYNTAGSAAGTDCTDSKSNTYTLANSILGGVSAPGIAVYYNIGGTRGTSHTVTINGPGGGTTTNVALIEITADGTISFDSTTDATASDATSTYDVTAAAAISGTQIAVYGCTLDTGGNGAWTQPTGYSNIYNEGNGNTSLVSCASYKNGETGTPTVGGAWTAGTPGAGRQIFVTFQEEGGAAATSLPFDSRLRRNILLRR